MALRLNFWWFQEMHWLDIVAVLGVLGTFVFGGLSIVFYFKSVRKPVPCYAVYPFRPRIVDKSVTSSSELQVTHHGKLIEAETVSAVLVYFWNDGRKPIRRNDVLQTFAVNYGEAEILAVSVFGKSRTVCQCAIGRIYPPNGTIELLFEIIEWGDGMGVQLIYAGNPELTFRVEGVCVGAAKPLDASKHVFSSGDASKLASAASMFSAGLLAFMGSVVGIVAIWRHWPFPSFSFFVGIGLLGMGNCIKAVLSVEGKARVLGGFRRSFGRLMAGL
ncbi:MAG TPA: hypothetical protein VGN17_00345 [Bryobacteraceae bacterium]